MLAEKEKLRAENSEAKTDTLRRLAVAKTLAVKSVKLFEDNSKIKGLSDEARVLPNILALQSYHLNKNYAGNIYDTDIFNALLVIGKGSIIIDDLHEDAVREVVLSPDGKFFISVSADGKIYKIELDNSNNIEEFNTNGDNDFRAVAYSKSGNYVVAGDRAGEIFLWQIDKLSEKPETSNIHKNIISGIVFIAEDKFVSSDIDGKVFLWKINANSFEKIDEYSTNQKNVTLKYNSNSNTVIVATKNGTILMLSGRDLSKKIVYNSEYDNISSVFLLKSGDLLVGHSNGLVERIDKTTKTEKQKWFAHNSAITGIIFHETNNQIITSSMDRTIKIWDSEDINAAPIIISEHNTWIYSIIFSKDAKRIISADADGNILITIIDIEILKNKVKGNLTKNMSENNWKKYVGEGIEYDSNLPNDL